MDIFFLQLAIIFLPGLIWERVDARFVQKRIPTQFDVLRRTFVFGLASYLATYGLYKLFGYSFDLIEPKKDVTFLNPSFLDQIVVSSVVAFVCSIAWLYAARLKLLMRFLHLIHASNRYGDEDVWDFTFNSRDINIEYLHLRDFEKRIVYAGWVNRFSDTDKVRELVLSDVKVYDFDGAELFTTPMVYISRPIDDIDIEFPFQNKPGEESD